MWLKSTAKYLAGLLLAALLLWWVLRGIDRDLLMEQMREVSIWGWVVAAVTGLSQNIFRAFRWRALLHPVSARVRFQPMFVAILLGYATSWVVPGRLGELVRPALLAGKERLPLGSCIGSVLADRLLDGLAVVVFFGVGLAVVPLDASAAEHTDVIRGAALFLIGAISFPIAVLLLAGGYRDRLERAAALRRGFIGWCFRTMLALATGVAALRSPRLLARVLFHTACTWWLIGLSTWLGIRATGVEIPFMGTFVLLPILVLGIAIPTPGGAGGYHAAMQLGLMKLFGIEESHAVGAALIQHAAVVLPVVVVGGLIVTFGRIGIRDLSEAVRQVKQMGMAPPERAAEQGKV